MQHIHLDLLGGLAGDMFLAGAIDAGLVSVVMLEEALSQIGLGRIRIETKRVVRRGISALHISFSGWSPEKEADHRHLSEILEMLESSGLEPNVAERASEMFRCLGRAEAEIHAIPVEEVHFHEVGAIDSILDFVSAAWILEHLDANWSASPVPNGQGTIEVDHGTIPVPAPATARLLEGSKIVPRDVDAELVTPTGATILRTLAPMKRAPAAVLQGSGYGAGTSDFDAVANVVRFMVFDIQEDSERETFDRVVMISADIDDMTPEILAHTEELLLDAGALDVTRQPVYMKKGRLGARIEVLAEPTDRDRLSELMLRETSTFGIRVDYVDRLKLARRIETFDTPYGSVQVKLGFWGDELVKATPEYEDCARKARAHNVSIQDVFHAARHAVSGGV